MRKTPFKKVLLYWIGLMGWSILLFTQFSANKKKKHIKVKIILLLFYSAQIQLLSLVCQHTESDQKKNSKFCRILLFICNFQIRSKSGIMPNLPRHIDSSNFVQINTFDKIENITWNQLITFAWKIFAS